MNELVKQNSNQLGFVEQALQEFDSALKYAEGIVNTKVLPKHYYDANGNPKPNAAQSVLLVMQMGKEIGMSTLQSIQQIIPVNNQLSIKGDGAKALILASGKCDSWVEEEEGTGDDFGCKITATRKDTKEKKTVKFSVSDAKRASLWITDEAVSKNSGLQYSPWRKYSKRMLRYRALGFIARDLFSDVLQGLSTLEEVEDYGRESERVDVATPAGPLTTNANIDKQNDMIAGAIKKADNKGKGKAASKIEDVQYEEVPETPATPKGNVDIKPVEENKTTESKDPLMDVFVTVPSEVDKMFGFVQANKEWSLTYLDGKLRDKGWNDHVQWLEMVGTPRTVKNIAEILIALRDTSYEDLCAKYYGAVPPVPVHDSSTPVKKAAPAATKKAQNKWVIPDPHRDFDAQQYVMEKVVEAGKDASDEYAENAGYQNWTDFIENCPSVDMVAYLES